MSASNSIADAYLKSWFFSVAFFIIANNLPGGRFASQSTSFGYGCKTSRREY